MYLVVNPQFSEFGDLKSWGNEILPFTSAQETRQSTFSCSASFLSSKYFKASLPTLIR